MDFKKRNLMVGFFAIAILLLFAWATIRVSDRTSVSGKGYELNVLLPNATGLKNKAPVELAGVQVGVVKKIELAEDSRNARATLIVNDKVKLPDDSIAVMRTRGFLGETYIELLPGKGAKNLADGGSISSSYRTGDMNALVSQFNEIAGDIKDVTGSVKEMTVPPNSPVRNTVNNLDTFVEALKEITLRNEANFDRIATNLAIATAHMRELMESSSKQMQETIANMASITGKVDRGEGTIGKLVNDEETVEKVNQAVDSLNETLGGYKKLEAEIGYHTEYLTDSEDFKQYASLVLKPTPDKAFMFDVVSDPDPRPTYSETTTNVTVGGATTTVNTQSATVARDQMKFSAQIAKKFYDATLRGGLIESKGGMGLDYDIGPMEASFSAFDFSTRFGQRPHLKAWATVNLSKNIYFMGGADDFINQNQSVDYFVGAGLRLVDDDIKSLVGMGKGAMLK